MLYHPTESDIKKFKESIIGWTIVDVKVDKKDEELFVLTLRNALESKPLKQMSFSATDLGWWYETL